MAKQFVSFADLDVKDRAVLLAHYVVALLIGLLMMPVLWGQAAQPSGGEMVDALHSAFGAHHARAVHAKGTIVTGTFTASTQAAAYTSAAHLQSSAGTLKVIARFSDFTSIPTIPDADPHGSPKGFAVRFVLPDGETTDVVSHSFNGFPVANAAEFAQLLRAIGKATGTPADPADLSQFLEAHPVAKHFLSSQKPAPRSWATTPYFGVNAFQFTNAAGTSRYVRYRFIPLAGEAYIDPSQQTSLAAEFLSGELRERLAKGAIHFRMEAQVAAANDDFRDPSTTWPESRQMIELGVLTLTRVVDGEDADRNLQFSPASVVPGIQVADPMLLVRSRAYPISASERQ